MPERLAGLPGAERGFPWPEWREGSAGSPALPRTPVIKSRAPLPDQHAYVSPRFYQRFGFRGELLCCKRDGRNPAAFLRGNRVLQGTAVPPRLPPQPPLGCGLPRLSPLRPKSLGEGVRRCFLRDAEPLQLRPVPGRGP